MKKQVTRPLASFDELDASGIGAGYTPYAQEVTQPVEVDQQKPRGMLRAVADTALQFGKGAVSGVRMMADVAGADNAASTSLRSAEDALGGLLSATAKQDQAQVAAIMQEAEGKGWMEQIALGLKAAGVAPGALLAQAAGTAIPTLATALIPGVGPASAVARLGAAGVMGGAQGVGVTKSAIYDATKQELLQAGASEAEAEARAIEAQSYSGANAGQIALGGGLGVLAGSTGMERVAAGLRGGVTKAAPGLAARMAGGGAVEAVPELIQGGQEKYATNSALANEGFAVDPMSGVVANATLEGAAGFGMGAAFGVPKPNVIPPVGTNQPTAPVAQPATPAGPMSRAVQSLQPSNFTGTPAGVAMNAAPVTEAGPGFNAGNVPAITDYTDQQDLAGLVESEQRDQQVQLAQIEQERIKQAQIEADFANQPTNEAIARAGTLEAPGIMAQAFAQQAQPAAEKQTPPAPPPPEPRTVERTADMQPMPLELAQLQVEMDGGEVVQTQNQNGKFAYHVVKAAPEPVKAEPPTGDILNAKGQPFTNLFAAKTAAGKAGAGYAPVQLGKFAYVVRKADDAASPDLQSGDSASPGAVSPDATSGMGAGAVAGNAVAADTGQRPDAVLGQSGELPNGVDASPLTESAHVQDPQAGAQAAPVEAPGAPAQVVASAATGADNLPGATGGAVEGAGVTRISRADLPNEQKPDATPEEVAATNEAEYQQSIKDGIRQRLGLDKATEEDQKKTPFKAFLREFGIHPDHTSDVVGRNRFQANQALPATFRAQGLSLDDLTERAIERGFLSEQDRGDTNKLITLIQDEIMGRKQVSSEFADEDAQAQSDRAQRLEIESLADKVGLPYSSDTRTDVLASMVNRVETRLKAEAAISFDGRGSLKRDRVLKHAQETVARIERKRAQYEAELTDFAKLTIAEQDALLDIAMDQDGNPVVLRQDDMQVEAAWQEAQHTWSDEYGQAYTPDHSHARQAEAPAAGVAAESIGDAEKDGAQAQPRSPQAQDGQEGLTTPTEADALRMGLGDFTANNADALISMPGGTWVLLDGRRASYENGEFNVAFSWGNGKWSAGDTASNPQDAYKSSLKRWTDRGNDAAGFKPAPKGRFLSGTQGPDLLASPTRAEILAQQDAAEQAAKTKEKADKDAEAKAKAERIAKEIQSRQDASADNFTLGQSAEDSLAGQGSVFDDQSQQSTGEFGPILTQYRHDAQGAIKALTELQDGEAVAALHHPEVGDIDLVWGKEGSRESNGLGLAKLVKWHPEVLTDLQAVISSLKVVERTENRVQLESETHKAAVRLEWDGKAKHWLLTAFEKRIVGGGTRTDTTANGVEGDTARLKSDTSSVAQPAPEGKPAKIEDGVQPAAKEEAAKPEANEAKPTTSIGDFGEKIGGAKKDLWATYQHQLADVNDADIATQPLSKSWPQPDYQALLDGGADPWTVGFVRAARDAIPRKPNDARKAKAWAGQVQVLREFAVKLLNGDVTRNHIRVQIAKLGEISRSMEGMFDRIQLYMLVGHSQSLEGVKVTRGEYGMHNGITYSPAKVIWTVNKEAKATAFSNWPRELGTGATKEEAIADFQAKYATTVIQPAASKEATFDIWSESGAGSVRGYFVGKKIGRNYVKLSKAFPTVKEARDYKTNNHAELVAKLEKAKEIPSVRRDTNMPRVGEDMRAGQDVTPQFFGETFGFKGVEFGNYVEQSKRQKDLNNAFDALMDMSAILGLPPKALSLNGQLGLAFGARGTGGIDPAAAHYERDYVAINLTKKEGAGSLGHEWWHAVDNYFSRMRKAGDAMMTEGLDVSLASKGSSYYHKGEVRKEMVDAFGAVMKAIRSTAIKARSSRLDAKRSKEYWTTSPEMSARAFESYLISKLRDNNASNDYLANIVDEKTWKAMESLGMELDDSYPYPNAGEIPAIRSGFEHFFDTVQTKETEQGIAMFSARDSAPEKQLPLNQVERLVQSALRGMQNAPVVRVVANPEAIGLTAPVNTVPAGVTLPNGDIYVFQSGVGSVLDVDMVVFHELFHKGLQNVLPKADYVATMQEIAKSDSKVRQYASDWSASNAGQAKLKELAELYSGKELAEQYEALATEEGLAWIAEDLKASREMGSKDMRLKPLAAWLAKVADKLGMTRLADAIRALSYSAAEKFVIDTIGKAGGRGPDGGVKFSSRDIKDGMTSNSAAPQVKPLTEKQFYSQYAQHIDLRGRDGSAAATREAILRDGFKKGVNVNAMPPYRGGAPKNISDKQFMPKKGDVVYLAPKGAWKDKPNGMEIQNGWMPKPYEVVIASEDGASMYQEYLKAFNESTAPTSGGDTSNPDIRFSMGARSVMTGQPLPQTWQAPDATQLDDFIYSMQDKHVDTKRVTQAITAAIGTLGDNINPYMQEELFHGRAAMATKEFLEQQVRPFLLELRTRNVEMSDFEEYLHNRHAKGRNEQVAKVNPQMPDGGSGIATADAQAYLAALTPAQRIAYQSLAKQIDQINRDTRALLISSGLEKQETIDAWQAAYGDEYVPLMREEMDNGMGIGQGFSVRGGSSKRAMGSDKPVANIIANITLQREKAITRSEKQRIGHALYGMVLSAPNSDFWFAVDPKLQQNPAQVLATSMQLISLGMTPADAESIAKEPTTRYIHPQTGLVESRINPAMRSADNVLAVRIDGEDKYVFFNAKDPRAMRMAKALKNLDADQLGRVMGTVAKMTRYFSAINTQYNPVFGVTNIARDIQTAMLNLQSTALKGHQAAVAKNILPALMGIYTDLRKHRAGKSATSAYAQIFEDFQRQGGATGFRDMYANAGERADAIKDELADIKAGKLKQLGKGIMGWLSDYNESMENAVRVSAYKVGLEQGLSKQQAASLAKNLTVNFNRKGQVALQAGALYAFFNASTQGTARIAETLFEGGKLSAVGKQIITGGLLLGAMQAVLLAAAGFDDEEPPDFVRERSLVIPIGDKKYLSIPMPLGFHVLPNIARIPTEWAMGGFKDTTKRIGQMVGLFADAFNPIGSAGLSLQTLTPTIIDPLAALSENKDFTGKPIAREDFNSMLPTAGHTRAKDSATIWAKYISQAVNFATGGTDYKPGMVSPTPDQLDYLIGQVTGGVGREVSKLSQVVSGGITGEEVPLYKIPLVGRFVGTTEGQSAEAGRFYNNLRAIGEHKVELDGLRKDNKGQEASVYLRENREATLVQMGTKLQAEVSKLNKSKRELVKSGASPERVRLLDVQITAKMKRFNDRVRAIQERSPA